MFALLGEIQFELVTHFDGLEINRATKFARHETLGGKPVLQRTGDELDELTIELAFHDYYCDPEAELKKLDAARLAAKALPLVWGNGVVEGSFVIESLRIVQQGATQYGKVISLSATVKLVEFVESAPLAAAVREKQASAPARQRKGQPARSKPTAKVVPATQTMQNRDGVAFTRITRN